MMIKKRLHNIYIDSPLWPNIRCKTSSSWMPQLISAWSLMSCCDCNILGYCFLLKKRHSEFYNIHPWFYLPFFRTYYIFSVSVSSISSKEYSENICFLMSKIDQYATSKLIRQKTKSALPEKNLFYFLSLHLASIISANWDNIAIL